MAFGLTLKRCKLINYKNGSVVTPFRCLAAIPLEGSTRAGVMPNSRQAKSRCRGGIQTMNLPVTSANVIHCWPTVGIGSIGALSTIIPTALSSTVEDARGELISFRSEVKDMAKPLHRLTFEQHRRSLPHSDAPVGSVNTSEQRPHRSAVDMYVDRPGLKCIGRDYGGDERFSGWKDPGYNEIIGKCYKATPEIPQPTSLFKRRKADLRENILLACLSHQ
ncbi:hypothetical protein T265_01868 [Opisthorchis viverrini]|uniref:Uncharacterized protein n=1 Tax=Opisthorchis viverrini TaxID=6198 RepID=A0A074ZWU5_OPIVI|nr:hypothetical protein T265_01868 [Opisthorchis viverrini]KER31933.1 hypothetical protein T265_01868 [Opisthorchis viverrini]